MLAAWDFDGGATVTAAARELRLQPELLQVLQATGTRYEVLDGQLVVTPPPGFAHEDLVLELAVPLRLACPSHLAVLGSGYRYFYAAPEPWHTTADLTVVVRDDVEEAGTVHPPVLVVEILSSSTRRTDLSFKRELYESAGVPSYWLVDPVLQTLTVLELQDGAHAEVGRLEGLGELTVRQPFPVSISPWGARP